MYHHRQLERGVRAMQGQKFVLTIFFVLDGEKGGNLTGLSSEWNGK